MTIVFEIVDEIIGIEPMMPSKMQTKNLKSLGL